MRTESVTDRSKKAYTAPQLIVHGTVAEITAQNKDWGVGDAFTFQNQPTAITS
jgi:hypothetical protein